MPHVESPSERAARVIQSRLTNADAAVGEAEWVPTWSSLLLEETVGQLLESPVSRVSDLFLGLWTVLAETRASLTLTMSNFLLDLVRLTFTRYGDKYLNDDFGWMVSQVKGCTEAQAYLALHALPPQWIATCREPLLFALGKSAFIDEARKALAPDEP